MSYKNQYESVGHFVKKDFVDKILIEKINNEVSSLDNVDIYYDKLGSLRRIERLYDKGASLAVVNEQVTEFLKGIFDYEFTIFKDKYNAKPAGGEGFFAHYDGVFQFTDKNNEIKNGWYEYGDSFVNVLVALDPYQAESGAIEIASAHKGGFDELLLNTKNNGTPDLLPEVEEKTNFQEMNLKLGDIAVFSNTCPHRSKKNKTKYNRRTLYYTYTPLKYGSMYEKYFEDKKNSTNKSSKSLSGEL